MFDERPVIDIPLTRSDKVIEAMGIVAIIASWYIVLANYSELPDTIATHFDGAGKADGYGDKDNIFALPIVSTVLFFGLSILGRFPRIFNYPVEITKENAERQYRIATSMMRFMKLSIAVVFALLSYGAIENAKGNSDGLGSWFLPVVLALIFVPMLYFFVKSTRKI